MAKSVHAYRSRQTLLSRGEAAFFGPLTAALAGRLLIMCKVRLADIITCSDAEWSLGRGRAISQKHLDFVLCDRVTTRLVAAIELDDRSHNRPERRRRDRFVNQVLAEAGIRLIRFQAQSRYAVQHIRHRILTSLEDSNPG